LGNDSYVVDNGSQKIVDSGGTDSVFASLSWTLQGGVENLYFTGTGDAVLTGNSGNNQIFGGSGNDTLNGGGGTDVLNGGQGDDLYYISNSGQSIVDAGGIDSVVATGSYVLVAAMENLRVSGTNNANLTGNDLANTLRGNSGANIIKGMAGVDTMYGGGGNDTYYVDDIGDQAIEVEAGVDLGGIDFVRAMVSSVTLGAGIENLGYFGKENFTGIGNALANTIGGYGGNDWLYGLDGNDILSGSLGNDVLDGGAGADRLTGGSGYDIFLLGKGEAGGDSITDFKGNGTGLGDIIKLTGWGAGTTMVQGIGSNWVITDGIDRSVAMVSITGALHPSDVLFG
ncbi:MAG: calcium-binding protein, partial [Polymorphobacter sp.]